MSRTDFRERRGPRRGFATGESLHRGSPPGGEFVPIDAYDAGERSAVVLRERMGAILATEPLAVAEYVSVADGLTLAELDRIERPAIASLAVRFGTTRLIDNELLDPGTGAGSVV